MDTIIEPLIRVHTRKTVKTTRRAVRVEQPSPGAEEPSIPTTHYRLLLNCRAGRPSLTVEGPAEPERG
ncbi:MAG: hypothetical protein AB1792_04750 [Candidatus Zixiibacteriota bacterium]